jgi:hypothetical protein
MVEDWQRFASAAGRRRWLAAKKRVPTPVSVAQGDALDIGSGHFPSSLLGSLCCEVPPAEGPPGAAGGPVDVGDGLFTYRQLLSLPSSPSAALARIEQAEAALRRRFAQTLLRWHSPAAKAIARDDLGPLPTAGRSIEELLLISNLADSPVPTRVRVALFRAATALPGVTVNPNAGDSLGRPGVLVSASYPHWEPVRFIFDPSTGELLTGLPMNGGPPDVSGPSSTVVAQGLVNSVTALPPGVEAIRGVGAPPAWTSPSAPPMISIAPTAGRPTTVFTVMLAATPGERRRPAPTVWLGASASSAGSGTYRRGRVLDPCLPGPATRAQPTTTTRRAGDLIYVYRVRPPFHRRTWCRGRYQLGIQVFPNPLPRHYTTPPYTGSSGTSIYFAVR